MLFNIAFLLFAACYATFADSLGDETLETVRKESKIFHPNTFKYSPLRPSLLRPAPFTLPPFNPPKSPFNPCQPEIPLHTTKPLSPYNPQISPFQPGGLRFKRSPFREGEPQYGQNQNRNQQKTWEVRPDLSRDQRGNTRGKVEIQRHGENHDINAGYEQVYRGPDKHSETWHVGGSFGW